MIVVLYIFAAIYFAVFYLPVYLPFLLSFLVSSPNWRLLKWALRIAAAESLLIALIPPPGLRHDFGDDVAGNLAGANHNFPIMVRWIWGGGLSCTAATVGVGLFLCLLRRLFRMKS